MVSYLPRCITLTFFNLKMALEEYIRQVKETWTSYTLELVNYQNKCRLIRYVLCSVVFRYLAHVFSEDGTISSISVARI